MHTSAGPVEIVARAKKEHPADGDSRRIHHTRAATNIARKHRQLREGSGVVRFDRRNVRLRETYKSGEDNMVPQCRCAETLVVILLCRMRPLLTARECMLGSWIYVSTILGLLGSR